MNRGEEMAEAAMIREAARFLFEENEARAKYQPIPEEFRPVTLADAYAVQDEYLTLLTKAGRGRLAGYKVALTTPVMQALMKVDQPLAGCVFASTVHQSPAVITSLDFVNVGAECEIAVRVGADLPVSGAPYDRDSVADAVGACMPAFELIEDRQAEYGGVTGAEIAAENAWNGGVVLGAEVVDWQSLDLAAVRCALTINDEAIGEGKGGDVMGHPFEALAWLANNLAERGRVLARGMLVMTGSIVPTQMLDPGDEAHLSIDGLGEVRLTVE
jgi:2-keto-4-pentenoate hydratase